MSSSIVSFAQSLSVKTVEIKRAEIREKIGLDLTAPDFDTKKIDANLMGDRLAGILDYLIENYQQGIYDRKLGSIAGEQNEVFENAYIQIKKLKFVNAVKKGNEITILMRIDLHKNAANVKQTVISFHFVDGISESDRVNELFSYLAITFRPERLFNRYLK